MVEKNNIHNQEVKDKAKKVVEKAKEKVTEVKNKTNKFLEEMGEDDEEF